MTRVFIFLTAAGFVLLAPFTPQNTAAASSAIPLSVLQLEKFAEPLPGLQEVHGWHCRDRRDRLGWHYHPRACKRTRPFGLFGGMYFDPFYYEWRYYDGRRHKGRRHKKGRRKGRRRGSKPR